MTIFQSLVLGIVQGITEFLPVSSSAHLVLVPWVFQWKDPGLAFDVFIHMGTLVAVFLYFIRDWIELFRAGLSSVVERRIGWDKKRMLFWQIALATVPGVVAGMLFHHQVETVFRDPVLIAIPLAVVGFAMYWVDGNYPSIRQLNDIKFVDALWIGIAQAFALIPGVSRSGSTMTIGRLLGLTRPNAAHFSFLMSFPITLGAFVFEARKLLELADTTFSASILWAGFLGSLISGFLSIHVLLGFLRFADFKVFAWYRMGVSIFIVLWSLLPMLAR